LGLVAEAAGEMCRAANDSAAAYSVRWPGRL